MKETRLIMGMPITIEITDRFVSKENIENVFEYFNHVDQKFSTYKDDSEVSQINHGELDPDKFSDEMKEVMKLAKQTTSQTNGYFDIYFQGKCDPSGLVKGWAIQNAANLISKQGFKNYYVDAGGDIQVAGKNPLGDYWKVGIKNPFNESQIVKVVYLADEGMATSGTYIRGQHIYNPKTGNKKISEIVSLTVIGPNIYEADRFATAAFAMEKQGIIFLESIPNLEGYMIDKHGIATFTSGFNKYTQQR